MIGTPAALQPMQEPTAAGGTWWPARSNRLGFALSSVVARIGCAPNVQTTQHQGSGPMNELIFHNVYRWGTAVLLLGNFVLFVLMIRNRKPGASIWAACFRSDSLTERGLRARRWGNVTWGIIVLWFGVAVACARP
jgi:hypothetical protein